MPPWRSRELETLFGGPLDASGLTEPAFQRLVDEKAVETDQLDFKRVNPGELPYPPNSPDPKTGWLKEQEFAKDVAALANHRGGLVLIGVGEDVATGVANKRTPVGPSTAAKEQQRLGFALRNYLAPPADFSFVPVPAQGGGWYLAVVVPPSPRSPHAVLGELGDDKHPLRYPVRHDRATIWLNEHEVAERYRRRLHAQEDQENRVRRAVEEGCAALARAEGVWLYVSVIPEFPVRGARLDTAAVARITAWHHGPSLPSPLGRHLSAFGRGIPAPGKITFSDSRTSSQDDESAIRLAYVELCLDGSAFAAKPINLISPHDRQVGDAALADDLVMLTDVTLRWCSDEAGSFGAATVVTGLVDASGEAGVIAAPLTLVGDRGTVPGARRVGGLPTATVTVDMSAVGTLKERLAVTHLVHGGLLHWFGLPESRQIRHDGCVDPERFGSGAQQVERWAEDYGVSCL